MKKIINKLTKKIKTIKIGVTLLFFVFIFVFVFFVFVPRVYSIFFNSNHNGSKKYEITTKKVNDLESKILQLKLNQKAKQLGIYPYHNKYSVVDYSQAQAVNTLKMYSGKTVAYIPKGSKYIKLHMQNGIFYYLFNNKILSEEVPK